MVKKYTIDQVKEYFESKKYTLLSTKYKDNKQKLEYICDNGHIDSMTFSSFKTGKRCPICKNVKKHTFEFVKSEFEKRNFTLISKIYNNAHQKLEYICDKGHINLLSYHALSRGSGCMNCAIIKRANNKRLPYKFVKSKFEEIGYTLLSTKYKDAHTKLDYICDKGHKHSITYCEFYIGNRCRTCSIIQRTGQNSYMWKGGVSKLNIPLYNTYAKKLSWCEEVRHDPENSDLLQVRCTNCNEWFNPTISIVTSRIRSLTKNNPVGEHHFYCSDECKNSCSIYRQRKYPKGFKVDRSREVQPELAAMVLERDSYECQRCGNKDDLECHHYEGIEQNPIESADIDACVTLCEACHLLAHKDKGCRYIDLKKENLC